jgi:hypothetical protein
MLRYLFQVSWVRTVKRTWTTVPVTSAKTGRPAWTTSTGTSASVRRPTRENYASTTSTSVLFDPRSATTEPLVPTPMGGTPASASTGGRARTAPRTSTIVRVPPASTELLASTGSAASTASVLPGKQVSFRQIYTCLKLSN